MAISRKADMTTVDGPAAYFTGNVTITGQFQRPLRPGSEARSGDGAVQALTGNAGEATTACIFITGSTDGLGRAAAMALLDHGHEVVPHARPTDRAATIAGWRRGPAGSPPAM